MGRTHRFRGSPLARHGSDPWFSEVLCGARQSIETPADVDLRRLYRLGWNVSLELRTGPLAARRSDEAPVAARIILSAALAAVEGIAMTAAQSDWAARHPASYARMARACIEEARIAEAQSWSRFPGDHEALPEVVEAQLHELAWQTMRLRELLFGPGLE